MRQSRPVVPVSNTPRQVSEADKVLGEHRTKARAPPESVWHGEDKGCTYEN